ncbi:MAG: hypothetical protein Q4E54_07940 [Lachnospiraceae bacterium]|nr:hypothetical protein [Lachnospiraceae bacterium]
MCGKTLLNMDEKVLKNTTYSIFSRRQADRQRHIISQKESRGLVQIAKVFTMFACGIPNRGIFLYAENMIAEYNDCFINRRRKN